jgi:hypothetical protein
MKLTGLALGLVLLVSSVAYAEPYEFYGCNFKDGKDMADLDKWIESWSGTMDGLKSQGYRAVILTPQYAQDPETPDFFWMGTWPDAAAMGAGQKEYFEDGAGDADNTKLNDIMDCSGSLWWGRAIRGGS